MPKQKCQQVPVQVSFFLLQFYFIFFAYYNIGSQRTMPTSAKTKLSASGGSGGEEILCWFYLSLLGSQTAMSKSAKTKLPASASAGRKISCFGFPLVF